jgi:hypothetical protein
MGTDHPRAGPILPGRSPRLGPLHRHTASLGSMAYTDRGIRTPTSRAATQYSQQPCNRSTNRRNIPCHGVHDNNR